MNISLLSLLERCKNFLDFFSYQNYTSVRIQMGNSVRPWQLAHTEHIFAYAEKFPNEQLEYPIVGLGSTAKVRGARRVLYLGRYDSERGLNLGWFGHDWRGDYRFLAVRIAL